MKSAPALVGFFLNRNNYYDLIVCIGLFSYNPPPLPPTLKPSTKNTLVKHASLLPLSLY